MEVSSHLVPTIKALWNMARGVKLLANMTIRLSLLHTRKWLQFNCEWMGNQERGLFHWSRESLKGLLSWH